MKHIKSLKSELKSSSYQELIKLYQTLPAAQMDILHGEVEGCILPTESTFGNMLSWLSTHMPFPGVWQGKGYQPSSHDSGIGYNRFNFFGKEIHTMRFATRQDVSAVDGKPVFMMDYKPYFNFLGWLSSLDEVRQIDDMNYLLCGYWQWPLIGRSQYFLYHIYGPVRPFKQ